MTSRIRPHVVLYQPEIPQNTGNIGRTCVALGAKLWLVQPLGFRLDTKRLHRAGLDYWNQLDWSLVPDWPALERALAAELPGHGGWRPRYWFFSRRGKRSLYESTFQPDDVLVFGSESRGLPETLLQAAPHRTVAIPMPGPVRSLNLANCVAVAAYELYRQTTPR